MVYQVRDEHRQDYDPGRGGWGAQAQRLEIERRREVEARYADTEPGGPVAAGGEDWKDQNTAPASNLKRERSPDDDGNEGSRQVSIMFPSSVLIAHDDDSELGWAIHWIKMRAECEVGAAWRFTFLLALSFVLYRYYSSHIHTFLGTMTCIHRDKRREGARIINYATEENMQINE